MESSSPTKTTARPRTFVAVAVVSLTVVCISFLWSRMALSAGLHDILSGKSFAAGHIHDRSTEPPLPAAITSDSSPHVSVPGVSLSTDPSVPPAVDSGVIPDFSDAWSAAYQKARAKVRASFTLVGDCYPYAFFNACVGCA